MKLAIMQPYFLPYIGYFQLIRSVDTFVFYDDVNYIKQGWINRNRILLNGSSFIFTLELLKAGSFKKINQIEIGGNREKILKTFHQAYNNAPFYNDVEPLISEIFYSEQKKLSDYIIFSTKLISEYLDLRTNYLISSEIEKDNDLKGQSRVIEICKRLNANRYINAIGGIDLYSGEEFTGNGLELSFLKSHEIHYSQYGNVFIPWLSIIDVLMFNSPETVNIMLDEYELI
jgi:hypothetical protein